MPSAPRKKAAPEAKRDRILDAARAVFEAEGLEGASLRGIAAKAGYTPAALYFHFDSKEAIYASLLEQSIAALKAFVDPIVAAAPSPSERFRAAALSVFDFYAANPRDLDLGFYLFRGGMRPHGVGRERDAELNAALDAALSPIAVTARELGADGILSRRVMADAFAHIVGVLLLSHTRRIRVFGTEPRAMMADYVETALKKLEVP